MPATRASRRGQVVRLTGVSVALAGVLTASEQAVAPPAPSNDQQNVDVTTGQAVELRLPHDALLTIRPTDLAAGKRRPVNIVSNLSAIPGPAEVVNAGPESFETPDMTPELRPDPNGGRYLVRVSSGRDVKKECVEHDFSIGPWNVTSADPPGSTIIDTYHRPNGEALSQVCLTEPKGAGYEL